MTRGRRQTLFVRKNLNDATSVHNDQSEQYFRVFL